MNSDVDNAPDQESPRTIVCTHAIVDEPFYRELQMHLKLWQRERYIQWLEVSPGSDVEHTMQTYLQQTHLILLLISPDFFAHDHCYRAMQMSLQERIRRQIPVVPVLVRTSAWKESPCGGLLALPGNEQPIAEWVHPEQAYEEIRSSLAYLLPGDMGFRQKLMQSTARSAPDPTSPQKRGEVQNNGIIIQPGGMNIGNVKSNQGHIGHIYGDVHNHH